MGCPSCYLTNKTSCSICGLKSNDSTSNNKTTNIYILECSNKTYGKTEGYKYYVGKTNNPTFRLEQHFTNYGSAWTKKYPPIRVLEVIPNCDDFDEDKYTLKYMSMYGVNNVRGGSFCQLKLDKSNTDTIQRMLDGSTNKCYICGQSNHFARQCNNKEDDWNFIDILSSLLAVVNDLKKQNNKSKKETIKKCIRCDRTGHTEENCYAKTDKSGEELLTFGCEYVEVYSCDYCGKEFETEKGARFHENVHCTMKNKKAKQTTKSSKNKCFRCGRENHYADECYASKHINGKNLE